MCAIRKGRLGSTIDFRERIGLLLRSPGCARYLAAEGVTLHIRQSGTRFSSEHWPSAYGERSVSPTRPWPFPRQLQLWPDQWNKKLAVCGSKFGMAAPALVPRVGFRSLAIVSVEETKMTERVLFAEGAHGTPTAELRTSRKARTSIALPLCHVRKSHATSSRSRNSSFTPWPRFSNIMRTLALPSPEPDAEHRFERRCATSW